MKIEIYRNDEYFSTHHVQHLTRTFSEEACEARKIIVEQEVVILRNNIKRVTGSDIGFSFWLVVGSALNAHSELLAWRERKSREALQEATCTL
jgi:hypothetical protein